MTHSDEELRKAWQRRTADRGSAEAAPEVSPETLASLAAGEIQGEQRLVLLDQIYRNPALKAEFEFLRSIAKGGRPSRPAVAWPLAIAATLFVALGGLLAYRALRGPAVEPLRDAAARVELLMPGDGARVSSADSIAWSPLPGATQYDVEVVSDEGVVLGTLTTAETRVRLPLVAAAAGAARWWVTARLRDGSSVRSEVRRLRLLDSPPPP